MVNINQAIEMAHSFAEDALDFVNLAGGKIIIATSKTVPSLYGIPQNSILEPSTSTITLSESFLNNCCANNSFTPLRTEVYSKVRMLYLLMNPSELKGGDLIMESLYFATALAMLKGLQVPMPDNQVESYFPNVIRVLKDEFHQDATIFKMPTGLYNGASFYKIRLTDAETKKYLNRYFPNRTNSTVKAIPDHSKGCKDNPFENIMEAVEFIKSFEKEAYDNDLLLQDIEQQKFFYDPEQGMYRIHWASPFVSQYTNNEPTRTFFVNQMDSHFFSFKPNLYRHKFLYRGQSDHYEGKPCVPNLFRDKTHNDNKDFLEFLIFSQEMEMLIHSHPLVQQLESGVELLHDTFRFKMNSVGLAQHYYNKSPFLDLTSDLEVMKFFATTDYDKDNDRYEAHTDESGLGIIYCYELQYPTAFQKHEGYVLNTIGKQIFMRPGAQCGFLLDMDLGVDLKKLPEVTAIYFKHNKDLSIKIFNESHKGEEYFAEDILQMAWSDRLCQRQKDRVVSRKTVEYNAQINHKSFDEIAKELKARNIKIDKYVPSFTESELDIYYDSIKKGWWQKFCEDIHFHGAEDELYRQALKDLPNEPRYRKAFYK